MEPVFNLFKVKFSKLDSLLENECPELYPGAKVNVFINFEMVLRKLRAKNIEEYLRTKNEDRVFEMISCIVNLISHYRLFFSKNKLYTNVYVYVNHPFDAYYKNRVINPDYRKHYEHRFTGDANTYTLNKTLETSIPFVKIILDYIENVYFIQSHAVESSLVPLIINEQPNDAVANFIISNDRYDYQYALKGYRIIRPKKDESYLVTKNNLLHILKMEERVGSKIDVPMTLYPFILSLLGDKERNIDKIRGVGLSSLLTLLEKAIKDKLITPEMYNINLLSMVINEEYRKMLLNNFYCIDLDTQRSLFNTMDIHAITDQLVNKFDNVSLKILNDKYFTLYPLQLLELTSADKLIKKKRKDIFL